MTTISPKDVVEQFMARIGAGDIDGAIEMHADDIVVDFPGLPDELPWAGRWEGTKRRSGTALSAGRSIFVISCSTYVSPRAIK